jgi:SpoVK/Ycf46/Vps4 family AAA+-type ATPase
VSASEELEKLAVQYANEAIRFDRQGSAQPAITRYERAVEILLKLCTLYPDAGQNRVYMEHVEGYRRRVKELKQNGSHHETSNPSSASSQTLNAQQLVLVEKPDVKWDDIANLHDAKRSIEEAIIYPAKRPDLFPLGWPRGILFFGPPGCGKTLLAAAIATEIDAVFFSVDAASVMSKWLGESEKNVAQLFHDAREASQGGSPAIIFIDEIDSLVGIRSDEVGGEVRARNQFLKEMDSVLDKKRNSLIYVIGATNKPWVLDEPFIRRFQKRIYVPLPDVEARMEMFRILTPSLRLAPDVDLNRLAERTQGYSGSDLRDIFQSAQIKVVREYFEDGGQERGAREISMSDLDEILVKRKPSVSSGVLRYYQTWFENYKAL